MAQTTISNEGCFDKEVKDQVNANFTELYGAGYGYVKTTAVALTATELGGSETNTSFTFPSNGAIFLNAWLNVTDAESGTVDIGTQGTSNDPDGILDGVSVAATGYVGAVAEPALTGLFITGDDPVSVTSSGDLNSCEATLYIRYIELPAL